MSKTIKVIDLLNKIANEEEIPKKIKCDDYIYFYDSNTKKYFQEGASFIYISFDLKDLNNEIEVVDDKIDIQSIEELDNKKATTLYQVIEQQNKILRAVKQLDNKTREV